MSGEGLLPAVLSSSGPVDYGGGALLFCAMGAAVDNVVLLDAVPDNPASAMRTGRSEFLYSALEAVERVGLPCHRDVEGLVVVVSAKVTSSHGLSFRSPGQLEQPSQPQVPWEETFGRV
jgi:hypothetical protein